MNSPGDRPNAHGTKLAEGSTHDYETDFSNNNNKKLTKF